MVLSCDLVFQLGPKKVVPLWLVEEKWRDIALPREQFDDIVRIGVESVFATPVCSTATSSGR